MSQDNLVEETPSGIQATTIRLMHYGPDALVEREIRSVDELQGLRGTQPVMWIDVDGPVDYETLAKFGQMFGLHPLALEDVVNKEQRSKFEEYPDHYFAVSRMVRIRRGKIDSEQLSVFGGKGFVITFQEKPGGDCLGSVRDRIRKSQAKIRELGSDHLAYALLDAVIDAYFPVLENLEERLECIEEELDADTSRAPSLALSRRINEIRRAILKLRRLVLPMRESVFAISRNIKNVTEETRIHFRDCYDHTIRIIEWVDSLKDDCMGIREQFQTAQNNHINEVMKFLTIITTLFTPLTFIAGIYGMNFNPDKGALNMPELNWPYGYVFALGLMGIVFVGLLCFLYSRGWLSNMLSGFRRKRRKVDEGSLMD